MFLCFLSFDPPELINLSTNPFISGEVYLQLTSDKILQENYISIDCQIDFKPSETDCSWGLPYPTWHFIAESSLVEHNPILRNNKREKEQWLFECSSNGNRIPNNMMFAVTKSLATSFFCRLKFKGKPTTHDPGNLLYKAIFFSEERKVYYSNPTCLI